MKDTIPMDEYIENFLDGDVEMFSFEVLLDTTGEIEIECGRSDMMEQLENEFGEDYSTLENTFVGLAAEHVGMNACAFVEIINSFGIEDAEDFAARFKYSDEVREDGKSPLYNFLVLLTPNKEMAITCGASNEMMSLAEIYGGEFAGEEEEFIEKTADDVLAHGFLFLKALESLGK